MSKELILELTCPGLGDHLFFSPLPRLAKELNIYERVYISSYSNFSQNNGIYKKMLWESNPYLDGIIDKKGIIPPPISNFPINSTQNIIDKYLDFFGIKDKTDSTPEIYYKPKLIEKLKNKIIYDPNCISWWVIENIDENKIYNFLEKNKIKIDFQLPLRYNGVPLKGVPILDYGNEFLNWVNVIFSCQELYCAFSGSSNLRASFSKQANIFLSEPLRHDVNVFKLPINKYINL